MAGRYPQDNQVAKHPAFEQGEEAQQKNDQFHVERAVDLKPGDLTESELRVWDRLAPELSRLGRLKPHFVDFLYEYCVVKARLDLLRSELDEEEWVYVTTGRHGKQIKSRPQVAQYNDDWRKFNSMVAQLGISPATELRFNDKQGGLFDDDEFGQI